MTLGEAAARADELAQAGSAQELEALRRGLDDDSPAARGSALLSVELLSRDHPSTVNAVRPLLHTLVSSDGNAAVRRASSRCATAALPPPRCVLSRSRASPDP